MTRIGARAPAVTDPRPIGVFDSGVGGLTVLREILRRTPRRIDDLPRRQRPRARTARDPTTRSATSRPSRSTRWSSATSRPSSSPATPRPRSRSATCAAATTCRSSASSGPGAATAALATRNRRVGVIATPATIRSHAYFSAIKDENPAVEVYEHATPTFVPMVEAGAARAVPRWRRASGRRWRRSSASATPRGEFVFPLPASARIDTLLLGCTHYPLLRPAIEAVAGDGIAIVDSASATASALAELLSINGLDAAPGDAATHIQLTTGDVAAFRSHRRADVRRRLPRRRRDRARRCRRAGRERRGMSRARASRHERSGGRAPLRGWRADRRLAGGVPARLGDRRGRDRHRPAGRAGRATRARRLGCGRTDRDRSGARGARAGCRRSSCRPRTGLSRGDGARRPAPRRGARDVAAGRRRAGSGRRSGRLDPGQRRHVPALISRMEGELLDQVVPAGGGFTRSTMALANRWVTSRQLGFLLGFMGTRVLGQYDLAILSAEAEDGRLLFVEENVRGTAHALGVPLDAVPDLDRAARDDPRLRVRGPSLAPAVPRRAASSASSACSAATPRRWAATRSGRSAGRCAASPAASTGWSGSWATSSAACSARPRRS